MTMTTRTQPFLNNFMTTQPFLNSLLFTTQLFEDETNLYIVLFIYIVKSSFLNVQCNQHVQFKNEQF